MALPLTETRAEGDTEIYDSAQRRTSVWSGPRALWERRRLLGVIVRRDIVSRYKRSALGLVWTVLNPLLEMAVLYVVFSHVFRRSAVQVPYVVYLLSGLVIVTQFRQTVIGVASSMINNAGTLARIYVPMELFAASAAMVALVNFAFSLIPLLAMMLITGATVSTTFPLVCVTAVLLSLFAYGLGSILAPAAVRFHDILNLTEIALTLIGYLAAIFYPLSIVPERFRVLERLNPLYHFVATFRTLLYGDSLGRLSSWAAVFGSTAVALALGGLVLFRSGRRAVAAL